MRKQTATWNASDRPASYWLEQAELATAHAKSRPGVDLDGFFAALRDAAEFKRLASLAA